VMTSDATGVRLLVFFCASGRTQISDSGDLLLWRGISSDLKCLWVHSSLIV
jgi:hypothetical protein